MHRPHAADGAGPPGCHVRRQPPFACSIHQVARQPQPPVPAARVPAGNRRLFPLVHEG